VRIDLSLIRYAVLPAPVALLAFESLSLESLVIRAGRYAIFGRPKVLSSCRGLSRDPFGRLDQRPWCGWRDFRTLLDVCLTLLDPACASYLLEGPA
jgi:hypothetical protein